MNNDERLAVAELITKENAKAIKELANAIKELSILVADEDKKTRETINNLIQLSVECQERHRSYDMRLSTKKELILKLEDKINSKADKEVVDTIKSIMIKMALGVIGGVAAVAATAIIYVLKMQNP